MMQPSVDDALVSHAGTPQDGAVLTATRDLLWIETSEDARTAALRLVDELGGIVVAPDAAGAAALPIDLSFGVGDPVVPSAAVDSVARLLLSRHLPGFVRDANRAVELAARTERLARDADVDALTGLANRRVMGRALGRLRTGDIVMMLDLDDFKLLNDRSGHLQGDEVLRALGRVISETVRARDLAGRFGGEEFLILLDAPTDDAGVESFLARLLVAWGQRRPHPVTFSVGIARVGPDQADAVKLADAAMYAAKRSGKNRWRWSGPAEPTAGSTLDLNAEPTAEHRDPAPGAGTAAAFVAHSLLSVPVAGRPALLAAFEDRLGRVDGWPGFQRLEVWTDRADPTSFVMVSWWDDESAFRAYMASDDHRESHARIPAGDSRPHPDRFTGYEVVTR